MIGRLVILLVCAAIGTSRAVAGDDVSVTISATVLPVCKFFSPSSLRETRPSDVAIRYSCTNGTSPSISLPPDARATCFACEGAIVVSGKAPAFNVATRGFGSDGGRTEIALEQLLRALHPDVQAAGPGAMTITVAP